MIEDIEHKISDMLKDNKSLANRIEENEKNNERYLDEIFLDLISVIEVFSREEKIIENHSWNKTEDSQKAIKRLLNAKRKANTMLEKYGIKRIEFEDGISHDDLCSVTDTEPDADKPNGFILSIEKDGYTRNGRLLRRAEVIIVKN